LAGGVALATGAHRVIGAVLLQGEDVFLLVRAHPRLPQACKHGPLAFSVSGSSWGRVRSKINV
jgi:hypothetical protein